MKKMKVKVRPAIIAPFYIPLDDRVLIVPDPTPDKIGNIKMADDVMEERKVTKGIVVAMGKNCTKEFVQIGSLVWYSKLAGSEININGDWVANKPTHIVMREVDCMGVLPTEVAPVFSPEVEDADITAWEKVAEKFYSGKKLTGVEKGTFALGLMNHDMMLMDSK